MKHHIMISLGILMGVVFAFRAAFAILEPGLGVRDAYLLGGLILSGWLIMGGIAEWRHARNSRKVRDTEIESIRLQGQNSGFIILPLPAASRLRNGAKTKMSWEETRVGNSHEN